MIIITFILIVSVLFLTNFAPGTWLTGWDNLHPEFNFALNIKRSLFAVWQEYQGLGLLGGMGHASDLPRQIFLWFTSSILPDHLLRYFYTFLMLLIGPLGVYFLIKSTSEELWLLRQRRISLPPSEVINLASFSGALFYLFNLATIQTFYVPFSTFTTHYAFLPWLIFVLVRYLKQPTRKNLLWLAIVNILAIPQAYVPTVFVVYLMAITLFIIFTCLSKSYRKESFKNSAKSFLVIFCINAFWLLPFLYFTLTNTNVVAESKINQMVSEEVFLRNKMFGDIQNVALLKGFWFDNKDLDKNGNYFFMLEPWIEHLNKPHVTLIGYVFFLIILLGIVHSFRKKDSKTYYPFLLLLIFSFSMLAIDTSLFSLLNSILRHHLPLFAQIFRFPFTKFSVLAAFSYTIFFALGIEFIFLSSAKLWKGLPIFLTAAVSLLLAIFNLPSFRGNLIYQRVRLKIPQEYFDLFEWFEKQDKTTRIANFPQAWHWGWTYYQWDYTGSGFLWYGIEQPILDRAFDVWNDKNEGYYWEISHAVHANDPGLLENVLKKYQINWILIDESVHVHAPSEALLIGKLKGMLNNSSITSFINSFGELSVYRVGLPFEEKKFVFFYDNPLRIEPTYQWANEDRAFADQEIYYSYPTSHFPFPTSPDYYYPFRELFTNNNVEDKKWQIKVKNQSISFKTKPPVKQKWTEGHLNLGSLWQKEKKVLVYRENLETYELSPLLSIDENKQSLISDENELGVEFPKYNLVKADEIDFTQKIGKKETCDPLKKGEYDLEVFNQEGKGFIRLSSTNTSSCTAFNYPYLDYEYSYLLEIESRNITGKEVLFYVLNETTKKGELEILLPKNKSWAKIYYVLPPKVLDGKGYSLHFDNVSIGKEKAANDIGNIKIYPIPFNLLKGLRFSENEQSSGNGEIDFSVKKKNPSLYEVHFQSKGASKDKLLLVLSQSFHQGWQAFMVKSPFSVNKLNTHVLVNNWANGWLLDETRDMGHETRIYIVFWPQVLEYLGFGLLLTIPLIIRFNSRYK